MLSLLCLQVARSHILFPLYLTSDSLDSIAFSYMYTRYQNDETQHPRLHNLPLSLKLCRPATQNPNIAKHKQRQVSPSYFSPYRRSQNKATECSASHSIPKPSGRASEATWRDPEQLKPAVRHRLGRAFCLCQALAAHPMRRI